MPDIQAMDWNAQLDLLLGDGLLRWSCWVVVWIKRCANGIRQLELRYRVVCDRNRVIYTFLEKGK